MMIDISENGLYTHEVLMYKSGGEFQIVRNKDFAQCFYPLTPRAELLQDTEAQVLGPDDESDGRSWFLNCKVGDVVKISFQRTQASGSDLKKISGVFLGHEQATTTQLALQGSARYFLIGTWDQWEGAHEMTWEGGGDYEYTVTLGAAGYESFQILLGGDWHCKLYPSKPDANPFLTHRILGPDPTGGTNWTIGANRKNDGGEGATYRVRLTVGEYDYVG